MDVGPTQPDNDQRQKSNMPRKTLQGYNTQKTEMVITLVSDKALLTFQLLRTCFMGLQRQRTDFRPKIQMSVVHRPAIKYSGVFPVCGFHVGFSDVGRNMTLQFTVPLDRAS